MSGDNNKSTILIADDSRVGLMHLVQILQDEYNIHTASSGVEAIQVARAVKPDIILLDIVMPHMDGYEALAVLRETLETKDIPVIFISSLDQEGNEEKGLTLGAVDYISKPYKPAIVKLRVSVQLKIVNQMRTINQLSLMDSSTKMPNRRYFDQRLREEWLRAKNEKQQLGILMMNIDKFRTYNAVYGYSQGDTGLSVVAEIISKNALTRPGDIVARWANDGFAVLLQNASLAECRTLGEDIRIAVEETIIPDSNGDPTNFTLSIGVNSVDHSLGEWDLEEFIKDADSALYLAKELGRNQVVVHS